MVIEKCQKYKMNQSMAGNFVEKEKKNNNFLLYNRYCCYAMKFLLVKCILRKFYFNIGTMLVLVHIFFYTINFQGIYLEVMPIIQALIIITLIVCKGYKPSNN